MHQYLDIIEETKKHGVFKGDRTGTGTQSTFGIQKRFSLRNNVLPVVTTKKIHLPSIIHELFWMLSGDTRVDYLIANGVRIWNEWVKLGTDVYQRLTATEIEAAVHKKVGGKYHVTFHAERERPPIQVHDLEDFELNTGYQPPHVDEGVTKIVSVNTYSYGEYREVVKHLPPEEHYLAILHHMLIGEPKKLVGGDLGAVYGKTWRDLEDTRVIPKLEWADYEARGFSFVVDIPGVSIETDRCVVTRRIDQIQDIINQLRDNPDSRRIIVCAWAPQLVDEQALPPCHSFFQFWTRELTREERIELFQSTKPEVYNNIDGTAEFFEHSADINGIPKRALSCQLYQRSCDEFLGLPFNITFYSLLTHMLANQMNMVAEEFIWTGGDTHIYSNHQAQTDLQLTREPFDQPTIRFNPDVAGMDIRKIEYDDFTIENYEFHPHIAGKVAV